MEVFYLLITVLCSGLLGFHLPWIGKRLLVYRKIPLSNTKDVSIFLGVIASLAGGMIVFRFSFFWEVMLAMIFLFLLLLIGWIDWHTGYILDQLTISGSLVIAGIQLVWNPSELSSKLVGSISIFLLLFLLAKTTNRLGQGDAKLMAMCALLMNWQSVLLAIWLASISGLIYLTIVSFRKKIGMRKYALPFGPHLAFGSFSSYLFGEQLNHLFSSEVVLSILSVHIL
ncbi:A24 family peptidase [Shimazuella sp. AN120528]|nr:A24 family peptidase [Shimazuella soli]